MENTFVVDFQFFRGNEKEIVIKSFSFCKLFDEDVVQHFVFKPPYEFMALNLIRRREAAHVTLNFHHLEWDQGFIEYEQAHKIIQSCLSNATEIFVKGLEKEKCLNSILGTKLCYNIENLDCPNFKTMKSQLSIHDPCSPVSSLNVLVMKQWLRNLLQNSLSLCNDAIRMYSERGLFAMRPKDLYFLPPHFLTHTLCADFLQNHLHRLAPHIVNETYFKNFLTYDSGYDTIN